MALHDIDPLLERSARSSPRRNSWRATGQTRAPSLLGGTRSPS